MDLHNEALRAFFLGPLEKRALRVLWARGNATLPELMAQGDFVCHINTLRTTLDRLCKKEFLVRLPEKGAFRYFPRFDEAQFQRKGMTEIVRSLLKEEDDPRAGLQNLVNAIAAHNGHSLDDLAEAIARKRERDLTK